MAKRKRIYGDGPRVGRDRSGPAPPQGRRGPAPAPTQGSPASVLAPKPKTAAPAPKTAASAPKRAASAPTPKRAAPAPVLAPKPKTSSLLERAAGEGPITDAEGLERAYAQGDTYTHGSTTYIAGSHTARVWWDDVTKIPFWGDSHKIYRMQMAQKALAANPQTTRVVGHSLGGSVALQAQKDNPKLASRTYGAPVWDPGGLDDRGYGILDKAMGEPGVVERYRSFGDPASFFDGSAKSTLPGKEALSFSGPHSFQGLAAQHMSEGVAPQENPDGSVSITE